jgi:hypothetical protein
LAVPDRTATDDELAGLVRRAEEAASALIRGDIAGYLSLIEHADDYTLMSPYGGDTVRGFDDSDQAVQGLAQFFRGARRRWSSWSRTRRANSRCRS